jgi:hypothetical protein
MKHNIALSAVVGALIVLSSTARAHAQLVAETTPTQTASGQMPTDVTPGSWAYQAVQDCAAKGLIAGYPPDGNFLGGRTMTRYEMATIVARILSKLDALAQSGASTTAIQPQVGEAGELASEYKVELTVIGTDLTQAKSDIAKLQGQVATLQEGLGSVYDALEEQAKRTTALKQQVAGIANSAYSSNPNSKYNITGYIQARAVFASSGSGSRFPQGTAAVQGAYNGDYAQTGAAGGAQVRRARLRLNGQLTNNSSYAACLDFSGMTTSSSQQTTVREAWAGYTLGDGNTKVYPTVQAGLFATPFGYILPLSMSSSITPERPLAFSEGSTFGLFNSQDYDKGVKATYNTPFGATVTYAAINGGGRQNENIDGHMDSVAHVAYSTPDKVINGGVSYYDGFVYRARPTSYSTTPAASGGIPVTQMTYPKPIKRLLGVDGEINLKSGAFVIGEYIKGTYEARSYFDNNWPLNTTWPTGDAALFNDGYVKHNQVEGWYLQGGYTFSATGSRPLTLAGDYDVFQRSINPHSNSSNALQGNNPNTTNSTTSPYQFFPGGSSFDDVNIGYGVLYNLDRAIRLRLWYDNPLSVAHATGTPEPPRIGLTTVEMQVKY